MVENDDVFMQVIVKKQLQGEALDHIEIELLQQREDRIATDTKIGELRSDIRELLDAWRAATGALKFAKFVATLAGVIGVIVAAFKTGHLSSPK